MLSKFFLILIQLCYSMTPRWMIINKYSYENKIYHNFTSLTNYCQFTDYLRDYYYPHPANFITCSDPLRSYVTLNQTYNGIKNCPTGQSAIKYCKRQCLISFDLYFSGTWQNKDVEFLLDQSQFLYKYQSPGSYQLNTGFCNETSYEIKTLNFTQNYESLLNFSFKTTVEGDGQVSINNLYILENKYVCYPSCLSCIGSGQNQCDQCYFGTPTNGICPPCLNNQYFVKGIGCRSKCNFIEPLCYKGFCQICQRFTIFYSSFYENAASFSWSVIYDEKSYDQGLIVVNNQKMFGIFKLLSGIQRMIWIQSAIGYYVGINIKIVVFNEWVQDCGIIIKFNNTYYGSIYKNISGIQLHNFISVSITKITESFDHYEYDIYGYFDIPEYSFLFSAQGNFTDESFGWAMKQISVTTDYCTPNCQECDVTYKCKICQQNFYLYRDGTCISSCDGLFQQIINTSYCKDFDDETPYSQLIVNEELFSSFEQSQEYNLIQHEGLNFLKGQDIYYSFWKGYQIFGGSYIWAKAKFKRTHLTNQPHHSISIAFYILFGPSFKGDGQFKYKIQSEIEVIKTISNANKINEDGTITVIVQEKINHNLTNLEVSFECSGSSNEPINAYCGLYNYYLAVHQCQPYCLECLDYNSCKTFDNTYNSTITKFSQSDCQSNQYYDQTKLVCVPCPPSCLSCESAIKCQTCQSTYTLTKLGCFCKKNEYENSNKCFQCPITCKQCLNENYCLECSIEQNRILKNGICVCQIGYQEVANNDICCQINLTDQQCNTQCTKCTQGKCLECATPGWQVDNTVNPWKCKEQCGDTLKVGNEFCDSFNVLPYKGCQNCQARCQSSCFKCDNINPVGCLVCNPGYILIDNLCYSICGDEIVTEEEDCDDGNLIYEDGCHFCQYSCLDSCLICIQGYCYEYKEEYFLQLQMTQIILGYELKTYQESQNLITYQCLEKAYDKFKDNCYQYCLQCKFIDCYLCGIYYIKFLNNQNCQQLNPSYNYDLEYCSIIVNDDCVQCVSQAYFDQIEGRCKLIQNVTCEVQVLLSSHIYCGQCFQYCLYCQYGTCSKCQKGYYLNNENICISQCGDDIITNEEQCETMDQNCLNCYYDYPRFCQYSHENICLQCITHYQYNKITKTCEPLCGDGIVTQDEECEDNNEIQFDGCYKCKYQCNQQCIQCEVGVCQQCQQNFQLINGQCLELIEQRNICLDDKICLDQQSISFSYLNQQLCNQQSGYQYNIYLNECTYICGDGIITQDEECDNLNNIENNRCINCKYTCPMNCLKCYFGKCLVCDIGFQIQSSQCVSECGNKLVQGDEICDDGNNINFDGCYNCQSSCQLQCTICQKTTCLQCINGWHLIDGRCESKCGDGELAQLSNEQCDDPNNLNCVNCQFQNCVSYCELCDYLQNCITCIYPFVLINQICQPICGDKIISYEFEDCDDGNDIPYDGCYQCQYQCSLGCIYCEKNNICKACDIKEYQLDQKSAKCVEINNLELIEEEKVEESKDNNEVCNQNSAMIQGLCENLCGNGQLNSEWEECDDGNIIGGDGCSIYCAVENSFKCQGLENQISFCAFIKAPEIQIQLLSDKQSSTQIVELSFTQQIKLSSELQIEDILQFQITPQAVYESNFIVLQNFTTQLKNSKCQLSISFKETVKDPILDIQIAKSTLYNEFELELLNLKNAIKLGNPFVLSQQTKNQLTTFVKMNDVIMYSTISISGFALLTGNKAMFFNLLDLLQSLSYIRFMQYQFPPHLRQFLDTYTKISLQPILDYFEIDEFLTQMNGGKPPFNINKSTIQSSNIIINSNYLTNAKGCYFSAIISIFTYILCTMLTSGWVSDKMNIILIKLKQNKRGLKYIQLFQSQIHKNCLNFKNYYTSQHIIQLYYTIIHQLAFSTLLQFPNYTFGSIFESINSLTAISSLLLIVYFNFLTLSITSSKIVNRNKWKYFFEGSKVGFWAVNFKSFQIYKVQFYLIIIVQFQNYPEAQSILLSTSSLIYLLYLCQFQPLTSKYELFKLILKEFFFMTTTGSFLIYSFKLTELKLLLIGWIHIGLFSAILSASLLIDMIEYTKNIYGKYLKRKLKLQLKKQQQQVSIQPLCLVQLQNQDKY